MNSRILIIQTAFIGDVILATPLIEKLKRFFPQAQIDFLLRKGNENLLENHPHLNRILIWDKKKNKFSNLFKIIIEIRKRKYDCVINLQRFPSTGFITIFSGAKTKIGFNKNPLSFLFTEKVNHKIGSGIHEVNRNLNLVKKLTDESPEIPKLYPSIKDFESVKQYQSEKYACIAPTSVWFTKQLPQSKWLELIERLNSKFLIYLIGGNEDIKVCDEIILKSSHRNIINLAGKLSFLQTAALMKGAEMNYVNDSAPMHIASAMNAPLTAFFCSTIPDFGFGPLSKKSKTVETLVKLSCRPCGLHGYKSCPEKHFKCATTILMTDDLVNFG
ncbi:MAG: glycosyltransferase family 9 protein [Bacteroidia bacterium]